MASSSYYRCFRDIFNLKSEDSCGTAIIEAALIIPFLIFTALAVSDLGGWLTAHLTASRIAFEACRYAASIPGLETGTFDEKVGSVSAAAKPNQIAIIKRVEEIVKRQNFSSSKFDPLQVSVYGERVNKGTTANDDNVVLIRIGLPLSFNFSEIFGLGNITVQASARASYLFPN